MNETISDDHSAECSVHHLDFNAVLQENSLTLGVVGALVPVICFVLSLLATKAEEATKHKEHLTALLYAFYKELTILGFVSFILFLAQTFNLVRWVSYLHLDEDITEAKISFLVRIIHMCLFVTMLFYIVLVIFLYILTNHTREYWTTAESKKFVNVERDFEQIRLNKKEGFRSLLHPITLYRYQKLYDLRTYHLLRRVFVQRNYLRKSFCFDVYLKRSSRKTLINLVTIHWIVWFALLAFVMGNFLQVKATNGSTTTASGLTSFTVIGYILGLLGLVLYIKMKLITRQLSRKLNWAQDDVIEMDKIQKSPHQAPNYDDNAKDKKTQETLTDREEEEIQIIEHEDHKKEREIKKQKSIEQIKRKHSKPGIRTIVKENHPELHFEDDDQDDEELDSDDSGSDSDDEFKIKERVLFLARARFEEHVTGLCCSKKIKSKTNFSKLFWFHSPGLFLRFIQMMVLSQAIYVTLYLVVFLTMGINEWGWYSVIIIVFPAFITLALFVPGTLPTYTLVRFVDSPSTVDVLATLKHSKIRIREAFQLRMREARAKSVKMNGKQLSKMEALHEVEQEIGVRYQLSQTIGKQELHRWKEILREELDENTTTDLPEFVDVALEK